MTITPRDKKRIQDLFARLGSQYAGEQETARKLLNELLEKLRLTWNDMPELLTSSDDSAASANGDADDPPDDQSVGIPNALELVHFTLQQFVDLKSPAEYVAVALWIMHTFVYDRFLITPRLGILSPVRECGKTTLLATLEALSARAKRLDDFSAAVLYHLIHTQRHTLLIDEADNADLERNAPLRKVLNSGHRKGGVVARVIGGEPVQFSTFSPIAIAAIGSLPLPLLSRTIIIDMQRSDGSKTLRHLDDVHASTDLDLAYRHIFMWSRTAQLDPNPEMPGRLRVADNWRVLIAIADSFGWGAAAREAAIALAREDSAEDIGVMLLSDIRVVFDDLVVDRIPSVNLVRRLIALDDANWGELPRGLSVSRLAAMLRPFKIRSRSIRALGHRDEGTQKGYLRSQFETAWVRYCPEAGTTAPTGKIKYLREV